MAKPPTQLDEQFHRALDQAFRSPVVLEGAVRHLEARMAALKQTVDTAAVLALHAQNRPQATEAGLKALGALTEVQSMYEIVKRWTE